MNIVKYVVSVDPGKATGIALISLSAEADALPELIYSDEVQPELFASRFLEYVGYSGWVEGLDIVCEKFTITTQTGKNSQAPWSLENIGVLKHICREYGRPEDSIHFQSPADAKNMFPNPTLKKVGLWHKGGEGHANDAIRHGLLYIVKSGWKPKILLD